MSVRIVFISLLLLFPCFLYPQVNVQKLNTEIEKLKADLVLGLP